MTRLVRHPRPLVWWCARRAHDAGRGDGEWIFDANNWQEGKDLLPDPVL
jgi:hypothetical protein